VGAASLSLNFGLTEQKIEGLLKYYGMEPTTTAQKNRNRFMAFIGEHPPLYTGKYH